MVQNTYILGTLEFLRHGLLDQLLANAKVCNTNVSRAYSLGPDLSVSEIITLYRVNSVNSPKDP